MKPLATSRLLALVLAGALAACTSRPLPPVAAFSVGNAAAGADAGTVKVNTGAQVRLDASASKDPQDAAGLQLKYAWRFARLPNGSLAVFDLPASPTPSFIADVPGEYEVELVVRSGIFESAPVELTITALACGAQKPVAGVLQFTPASPGVGTPVQLSAPDVADPDNAAGCDQKQQLSLAWAITAQPSGSRARLNDTTAKKPDFTPDASGAYVIELVVTDSTGLQSDTGRLTINAGVCGGNRPVLGKVQSSNDKPGVGATVQLSVSVTDGDLLDPCNLKQTEYYAWSLIEVPFGSHAALNASAVAAPSFTVDASGTYRIRVVVTDSTGLQSDPGDVIVQATSCGGNAPVAFVAVPTFAAIGAPVQLTASVTDDDITLCSLTQTFRYAWRLTAQPAGSTAHLNSPSAVSPSFTPDVAGDYSLVLVVTDSGGIVSLPVTATVTVTTCGGGTPSVDALTASPAAPNSGQRVLITPTVSDPDSACANFDPTRAYGWALISKPAGSAAFLRDPSAAIADFVADLPGPYQVALQVADAAGRKSGTRVATVLVNPCGFAPPAITGATASDLAPDPGKLVRLSAVVVDSDNGTTCNLGQTVTLRWSAISRPPGSGASLSDPAASQPTFTPDVPGTYQFLAVATDSTGLRSAPAFVTLQATVCGSRPPTVTVSPTDFATQPGTVVALSAIPSDPDSTCGLAETFTYDWRVSSSPLASAAAVSDPRSPAPTFTPDVSGAYLLQVSVADTVGHVSAPAFVRVTAGGCAELPPSVASVALSQAGLGQTVTASAAGVLNGNCAAPGPVAYHWTLSRPPTSQASLSDPSAAAPTLVPDVAGNYQVMLVVTSSAGRSSVPVFATLSVPACGASSFGNGSLISFSASEPDGSAVAPSGVPAAVHPFVGSTVALAATIVETSPTCATLPLTPYRYRWNLTSRPAGSIASLDDPSGPTPGFSPDVPGDYQVALSVTDALGSRSPTLFATIHGSSCGGNRPVVAVTPAGPLAIQQRQDVALCIAKTGAPACPTGGAATSADDSCPARFRPSYSYSWRVAAGPSGGGRLGSATGASTSFRADLPGTYRVELVAHSSNGTSSDPAAVSLTAGSCGSNPPVVTGTATLVNGAAGSRPAVHDDVQVTALTTDPDSTCPTPLSASTYTWSLVTPPSGSAVVWSAAGATLDFHPDVAGSYTFKVVAADQTGLASAPFVVTVGTAACAPTFSFPAPFTSGPAVNKAMTLGLATLADSCVLTPSYTFAWTVLQRPAGSLAQPGATSIQGGNAAAASTTFTPDVAGRFVFQLSVTDNGGVNTTQSATVDVASCGSVLPVLHPSCQSPSCTVPAAGDFTASPVHQQVGAVGKTTPDTGDEVALSVPNVDDGNNAGSCGSAAAVTPLRYQWALLSAPGGSTARLSSNTSATPTLAPDRVGTYRLSVVVTDALGNASLPSFHTLTTSNCGRNRPLASINTAPGTAISTGVTATLTAIASDADDTSCPPRFANPGGLTRTWLLTSAPAGSAAALTAAAGATSTLTPDLPGTYVVQLTATDVTGLSGSATTSIAVNACGSSTPVITSVNSGVARPSVGAVVTLVANSTDADELVGGICGATPLAVDTSFLWTLASAPPGSNATGTAGYLPADNITVPAPPPTKSTISFTADVAGTYTFRVTARDAAGHTSAPFTIGVTTGTCGPNLTSVSASPSSTPVVGSLVTLSSTPGAPVSNCVTASAVTYAWSVTGRPPGSSAALSSASAAAPTFAPDVAGDYRFMLVVTDAGGFTRSAETVISARACTVAPTVAGLAAAPGSAQEAGTTFTLTPGVLGTGCGAAAGSQVTSFLYGFTSKPPGSSAVIGPGSTPSFVADVPSGTWQISLVVKDNLGNSSAPVYASVTTNDCGARVPTASVMPSNAAPNAFERVNLVATASDNEAGCSAGFRFSTFSYAWSVLSKPVGSSPLLAAATGASSGFSADLAGAYVVRMIATGANGVASAPVDTTLTVGGCGVTPPGPLTQGTLPAFTAQQRRYDGQLRSSTSITPGTLDTRVPVVVSANVVDANAACGATAISLRWQLTGAPAGSAAALSGATGNSAGLFPDLQGTYTVQLTVTDDLGLTTSTPFSFTTGTCGTNAPAAVDGALPALGATQLFAGVVHTSDTVAAHRLVVGSTVRLTANVFDADSQATCSMLEADTYAWTLLQAPAGSRAQLDSASGTMPAFLPDVSGSYLVQLIATDATGFTGPAKTLPLQIDCGTAAPAATDVGGTAFSASQTAAAVTTASAGATVAVPISHTTLANASSVAFYPGLPIALAAHVVDADTDPAGCNLAQTVTYAWSFAALPAGSLASFDNATSATPTFVPDVGGRYDVRLQLTDQSGYSSTRVFGLAGGSPLINVSACGLQAPTATVTVTAPTAGAPGAATAVALTNDTVSLTATSTDADTTPLDLGTGAGCGLSQPASYKWAFTSLPAASAALAFSSATSATTSFVPAFDGHYVLTLTASDGVLSSPPANLDVTVLTPSAGLSTLTATPSAGSPPSPVANGTDSYDVTLTVRNAAGVALPGVTATLSVPAASAGFTNTLSPVSGAVTNASGQITAKVSSTEASSFFVSANVAGRFPLSVAVSFVTGPPALMAFRNLINPTQLAENLLTAGGSAQIFVRVFDATGNPIIGNAACNNQYNLVASLTQDGAAFGTSALRGTLTRPVSFSLAAGRCQAIFTDLSLVKWGTGFQLQIAATPIGGAPALPPLTATFDISPNNPPNPPQSVTASGLAAGSDNINQLTLYATPTSTPNGEKTFAVFPSGVHPALLQAVPIAGANTPITFTSLADATRYSYQVTTEDAAGQDSTTAVSISVFTAPSAPTLDDAQTTNTATSITVHWAPPASGFGAGTTVAYQQVARATQANLSDLAPVSGQLSTTSTSYTDSAGLSQGAQYYYVVQAVNDGGRRASNRTAAWSLVAPPAAPATLSGTPGHNAVLLSWSAVGGVNPAVSYNVFVHTPPPVGTPINGTSTSYLAIGLTDGTAETFYVTAVNQYGQESGTRSGTFTPTAPVAPAGLTSKGAAGQVTLTWTTSAVDTAGYQVVRATANDCTTGAVTLTASTPGATFVDTPAANTIFYYCVSGSNATASVATVVSGEVTDPNATCNASSAAAPVCTCNGGYGGDGTTCFALGLATGALHSCSVDSGNALGCWGTNSSGQLGDNTTVDRQARTGVSGGGSWLSAAAGASHTCAIKSDGTLWCWGANNLGQLGDGTQTQRPAPVQESSGATTWTQVAAGGDSTCAVRSTGSVYCWGSNAAGQDGGGNASPAFHKDPAQIGSSTNWLSVAVGNDHVCSLRNIGKQLWCWGLGDSGQLGRTASGIQVPAQVGNAADWAMVAAGNQTGCAIKGAGGSAGQLFCWGQLPATSTAAPARIGADSDWGTVSVGDATVCGVKSPSNSVFCFGSNDHGQLGRSALNLSGSQAAAALNTAQTYAAVATRGFHSCGVRRTDSLPECWGSNDRSELGLGAGVAGRKLSPTQVGANTDWTSLSASQQGTCGLRADQAGQPAQRTLWCAGLNASGESGAGNVLPVQTSARSGTDLDWASLAGGSAQFLGLKQGSPAARFFWGDDSNAMSGSGTNASSTVPTLVNEGATPPAWTQLAAGTSSACGIAGGKLFCWGANSKGEAGGTVGSATSTPAQFGALADWTSVVMGYLTTCGLEGAALSCWGDNSSGQLAKSGGGQFATPQAIAASNGGWTAVAVGSNHACGIDGGQLFCWGSNSRGQLGLGGGGAQTSPQRESTKGNNWTTVAAGQSTTCATRTDGTLWCWGLNDNGQLGLGDTADRQDPTQIGSDTHWASVVPARVASGASGFTCALKTTGTLWCWGSNEYGWQGDNSAFRLAPGAVQ